MLSAIRGNAFTMADELIARASTKIDAPAADVWQALTDPALIKHYMAGADVKTTWKVGDPITYKGEWNGKKFEDKGEILEFVPQKRLKSTHFSPMSGQPDVPENYHVVTYALSSEGDKTMLTVIQENNPSAEMVAESEKTWAMMLEGIKTVVESPVGDRYTP
jgi:uncharacterized protein YndB with AHSA1/START domain